MTNQQTEMNVKVTFDSETMKAIKNIAKSKKQVAPILESVKFETMSNGNMKVTHTDGINRITSITELNTLHCNTDQENVFLLPTDVIKSVKGIKKDSVYSIELLDNNRLIFNDNGIQQTVYSMNASEYPVQRKLLNEGCTVGTLNYDDLQVLKSASLSVSKTDTRPVLMNVELKEGKAVSTDSHRLYKATLSNMDQEKSVLLNKVAIDKIATMAGKNKDFYATVKVDNNFLEIESDSNLYQIEMNEGNYPETSRLIPDDFSNSFTVLDGKQFEKTVQSINKIAKTDRNSVMKLELIGMSTIKISAKSELGEMVADFTVQSHIGNEDFTISFSSAYLLDALKQLDKPSTIMFNFNGYMRPFIINEPNNEEEIALVLPVRPC